MTPRSSAPVESRVRGNAHARFGGRAGETDPPQGGHRAPARPYTLAWLSKCRAILVRWDKKAENYLGLLKLACILLWFRRYHRLIRRP
jgi:transposase